MMLPNNTPKQFSWYENKGLENPQLEDGNTPNGTKQGRIYTSDLTSADKYNTNYQSAIVSAVSSRTTKGNDYSSFIDVSYTAELVGQYATNPGFFGSNLISENDSFTIKSADKDYVRGIITKVLDITTVTGNSGPTAGTVDTSFVYGTGFDDEIFSIAIQSNGKIICVGFFTDYDGTPANRIIRLNTDGSVDTSFVYGTGFNNYTYSISIQSDGKMLVGGSFTDYDGTPANRIIRLNTDGSVDTSFVYGTGFNGDVRSISIQSNGKILVGGQFTTYNGTGANRIIRLNSDGSVDTSFVYGTGFNGNVVWNINIQSNGKILVGGQFTTYNGTGANRIIRLNSDGSVDTSFVYGTGCDSGVYSIAIQSDNKIVVGGNFTDYDGTPANYVIRLNSDGSVDTSFVLGITIDDRIYSTAIQVDGKILVGGNFNLKIIRLNTDGSVDTSFVYGTGFNNLVFAIATQSDGKILIGGDFTDYDGTPTNRIIRVWPGMPNVTYTYNLQCSIIQGNSMTITTGDDFVWKRSLVMDEANFEEANYPINLRSSLNYNTRELFFYWDNVNKESREYRLSFRFSLSSLPPNYTIIKVHGNTANPKTELTAFSNGSNSQISCIRIDDPGIDMNSNRTINIKGNGTGALFATMLDNNGSLMINDFYVYDCTIGTNKLEIVSEKMRPEFKAQYPKPNNHSYIEGLPVLGTHKYFFVDNIVSTAYNTYTVDVFDAETGLPIVITAAWKNSILNTYIKTHDGVYAINLGNGYTGNLKAEVKKIPDNVQAYVDPQIPGSVIPGIGTDWAWSVSAIYDDTNKKYTGWAPEDYIHF